MADLPLRLICVTANHCSNAIGFWTVILRVMPVCHEFLGLLASKGRKARPCPPLSSVRKAYWAFSHDALSTTLNMSKDWTRTWHTVDGSRVTLMTSPVVAAFCFALILMLTLSLLGGPTRPTVNRPLATIIDWFGLIL